MVAEEEEDAEEEEEEEEEEEDEVDTKAAEAVTDGWHIFGRECHKEEIVFLCQVIILYTSSWSASIT